ncbi:hypothetical protein [Serratia ureilytica]|uniref:hypothetical protein n=1 Tax=Serratia ureilytica TaxID=300181 RepID=UPI00371ABABF
MKPNFATEKNELANTNFSDRRFRWRWRVVGENMNALRDVWIFAWLIVDACGQVSAGLF